MTEHSTERGREIFYRIVREWGGGNHPSLRGIKGVTREYGTQNRDPKSRPRSFIGRRGLGLHGLRRGDVLQLDWCEAGIKLGYVGFQSDLRGKQQKNLHLMVDSCVQSDIVIIYLGRHGSAGSNRASQSIDIHLTAHMQIPIYFLAFT